MKILVTGSSGHLGEALVRTLREQAHEVVALDILESPFTTEVGSIADRAFVRRCMAGVEAVLHAATLHKPHVATHSRQDFVDTNVTGTLNLLEEAAAAGVRSFVFTSTTSVFGDALVPPPGAPAAWVTEDVRAGARRTSTASPRRRPRICASCSTATRACPASCSGRRASFPRRTTTRSVRDAYADENVKANEYLYRRVDVRGRGRARICWRASMRRRIGFGRYIISATTPFSPDDLAGAARGRAAGGRADACPDYEAEYARRGWTMFPSIDRVYVNERARARAGLAAALRLRLRDRAPAPRARIPQPAGARRRRQGLSRGTFAEGPYPVD